MIHTSDLKFDGRNALRSFEPHFSLVATRSTYVTRESVFVSAGTTHRNDGRTERSGAIPVRGRARSKNQFDGLQLI